MDRQPTELGCFPRYADKIGDGDGESNDKLADDDVEAPKGDMVNLRTDNVDEGSYCLSRIVSALPPQDNVSGPRDLPLSIVKVPQSNQMIRHSKPRPSTTTSLSMSPPLHNQPFRRRAIETPPQLTLTILQHSKVKFGPGFLVREVSTGFETRWVVLGNIPSRVTSDDINGILQPFGKVVAVKMPQTRSSLMNVRAQLADSKEAMQAATVLNGARLFNRTISVRLTVNDSRGGNATVADSSVRIQWDAPVRFGYAGYSNLAAAQAAIRKATGALLRGSYITASLYEGLPTIDAYNVRFRLPSDGRKEDVERFGASEDIMLDQEANYKSLQNAVNQIKRKLEEMGELTFEVLPPPYRDGLVRAWANFRSPSIAKIASDYLNSRRLRYIGNKKLKARHVQTLSYSLPSIVYSRVASDIDRLRESCRNRGEVTYVMVDRRKQMRDPNQPVFVKLSADNTRDLSHLKTELETYLRGEPVRQDGKAAWDDFFGRPAGATFLRGLEGQYPGVSTETDIPRRSIALFGPDEQRAPTRDAILQKINDLRGQQVHTIRLAGKDIGLFMSAELLELQEELGHENVILHLLGCTLTIRGDNAAYQAALQAVRKAKSRQSGGRHRQDAACPVCFNEATSPVTLHCGHSWCTSCLSSYLISASDNKLFPLKCLGSEAKCSQLLPLSIARDILSASEFENLAHASFLAYIHSRPDEFHYCPTPDCAQVYRTAPEDTVLQCPSCLARICPSCHVGYHDGQGCAERQNGGEELFRRWTRRHNVKNCPGCRAPIEKSEGCNHMTCIRCQTHICWVCLKTFPDGKRIYEHMRGEHGGIGL